MTIVHAADLHIDSPLRGLERYEGAPVDAMRGATRRAFENLVTLCLEEKAKLLLLAGDLFDGSWRDYATGLFFAKEISRLREGGVRVLWVRGNHDAASEVRRHLTLPENARELSVAEAETVEFEDFGVAVHGQGFGQRSVADDLARTYPDARPGVVNIGLLHTSLTGRPGHDDYAPSSLETLRSKGYDYWALGHVHRREVVSERPWVVFPGNLQGRHIREVGPKGATVIRLARGAIESVEHRVLDAARWVELVVDAGLAVSPHDAIDAARLGLERARDEAENRPVAVRVAFSGTSSAHEALVAARDRWEAQLRATATDVGNVWLEKVTFATRAQRELAAAVEREDALGQIARSVASLELDEARLRSFAEALGEMDRKLPAEVRVEQAARFDSLDNVRSLLPDVIDLVLARLGTQEPDR